MNGFLITAQYALDDIPLRLLPTRETAMILMEFFQRLHPDRLHEFTQEVTKEMGGTARYHDGARNQIVGAELALIEFRDSKVVGHEIFGLGERKDRNGS